LAERAGTLLLGLRAEGGDPGDLRKAGDRLSHEFLAAELAARRPGDAVLSEEGSDDRARLSADRVWIVDPLDGTREFGEPGRIDWAVHVALWERGELTAGAVALPAQGQVLSTTAPPSASSGPATPPKAGPSPTTPPNVPTANRLSGVGTRLPRILVHTCQPGFRGGLREACGAA